MMTLHVPPEKPWKGQKQFSPYLVRFIDARESHWVLENSCLRHHSLAKEFGAVARNEHLVDYERRPADL
jgi:hypothetical protein